MGSAVVVVIPVACDAFAQLLECGGLVRVEEPDHGLMRAFVLALGGRLTRQATDRHSAAGSKENLDGSDAALSQLIEGQ